jgi:DNA-binding protein H-NS
MAAKKITDKDILDFDFEQLESDKLHSLSDRLLGIISDRREQDKLAFVEEIREKADRLGLDVEELLNQASGAAKKQRAPTKPKYEIIYDDGSRVVWSGKGRMKKAFAEWKDDNPDSSIDELLIKEAE